MEINTEENYIYESIHNLYEMARIGWFDNFEVCIYGEERTIPHLHIKDKQTEKECCIKLDKPEYFFHGDREYFKLNSKQKKEFIKWLNTYKKNKSKIDIGITNWWSICDLWDINNPDNELKNWDMPNYNLL